MKGFNSAASAIAVGEGSVRMKATYEGKEAIITLNNVLHVPAARCNLVSQSKLDRFGVDSHTKNGHIFLSKAGKCFIEGQLDHACTVHTFGYFKKVSECDLVRVYQF